MSSSTRRFKNREPFVEDYDKIADWIDVAKDIHITNEMVISFFRQIFRLLEVNNMCFSSGAFVFENYGNILFNLLTYNKLVIQNNSYFCDEPLTGEIETADVHIMGTETHNGFYTKYRKGGAIEIKPRTCMPSTSLTPFSTSNKTKTKFERLFKPKIENICGYCEPIKAERSEPKGLVLYYPFYVVSQTFPTLKQEISRTTEMMYVKFEAASVKEEPLTHASLFLSKTVGIKKEYKQLDNRREDKCDYDNSYLNKDIEFYRAYCPEDMEVLHWYNTYIRLGCEFFVSNGMLIYFIKTFLLTEFNCSSAKNINEVDEDRNRAGGSKRFKKLKYLKHKKTKHLKRKKTKYSKTKKTTKRKCN
jgi:hypothetical protein